jgi:hypothetical protein
LPATTEERRMKKINANSCRICLKSKVKSCQLPLFSDDENLVSLVKYVSGVELFPADDLPDIICKTCIKKMEEAAKIKRICIESNEKLVNVMDQLENMVEENLVTYTITEIKEIEIGKEEIQEEIQDQNENIQMQIPIKEEIKTENPFVDENDGTDQEWDPEPKPKRRKARQPRAKRMTKNKEPHQDQENINQMEVEDTTDCDACGQVFKDNDSVTDHIRFDHLNVRYQCGFCKEPFLTRSGLDIHLSQHDKYKRKEKNNVCIVCGRKYSSEKSLFQHMGKVCNSKEFQCQKCFRGFDKREDLTKHMRTEKDCSLDEY